MKIDTSLNSTTNKLNLDNYWLPFTPNRQFKENPDLISNASGHHYYLEGGRKILDAISGLWCVNAGHCRTPIVDAIKKQVTELDYATAFNMSHKSVFLTANKIAKLMPENLNKIFFTNSGSEAVDSSLKIAAAYFQAIGEKSKHRFIGRERGYHGVGFGGISVGGIPSNRKVFSQCLIPGVDHIRHTHIPEKNLFSKSQPHHGAELADDLERIIQLHDASNIAALIIEPIAGSTGVLIPPIGYLERVRKICDEHKILLIFDEVITGFGRTGSAFASQSFNVTPDMIVFAKGVTNGTIPMGGVAVRQDIYESMMHGPKWLIELFHGYTYSGHPIASAAANATIDLYESEKLFDKAKDLSPYFQKKVHSLSNSKHVVDIRNYGLMCGIELEKIKEKPGVRAYDCFKKCLDAGVLVRNAGDVIALTPPLITDEKNIDLIVDTVHDALNSI